MARLGNIKPKHTNSDYRRPPLNKNKQNTVFLHPNSGVRKIRPNPMANLDRMDVCPFLMRIFARVDEPHSINDFKDNEYPTKEEIQLYAWEDITLSELHCLLSDISEPIKTALYGVEFFLVQKANNDVSMKFLGYIKTGQYSSVSRKLYNLGFRIGDVVAVRIRNKSQPLDA